MNNWDSQLTQYQQLYPQTCDALRLLAKNPLLAEPIHYLVAEHKDYVKRIDPLFNALRLYYASKEESFDNALHAALEYTGIILRHQVQFLGSGEYSHSDFQTAYDEVYNNSELMLKTYLPGLFLTQALWPVHYSVWSYFQDVFLDDCKAEPPRHLLDVGVGHGLYLLTAMQRFSGASAMAMDVSRYSLDFTGDLLRANGIADDRVSFAQVDIREPATCPSRANVGILGEVIEHVEDPLGVLNNFHELLKPGAKAFVTTVVDSNAIDHIYQFENTMEIRNMIKKARFEIQHEQSLLPRELRLKKTASSDPTEFYVAALKAI